MLAAVQRVLLLVFGILAALTALLQVRYGMLCGKSGQEDPQQDPKTLACRKQAAAAAVGAAVSLALCIAVGAIVRFAA